MDWNDRDDTFSLADASTWPDDSYAGHERDFADLLDDDTMASLGYAYELVTDADGADFTQACYTIFHLMLGHEAVFLAMTGAAGLGPDNPLAAHRLALRRTIQYEDARDGSGMYFHLRLQERLQEGG